MSKSGIKILKLNRRQISIVTPELSFQSNSAIKMKFESSLEKCSGIKVEDTTEYQNMVGFEVKFQYTESDLRAKVRFLADFQVFVFVSF